MEMKLGVVTLEQLGQRQRRTNRPRRKPEPTQREENPLQVPPSNRTAIYVKDSSIGPDGKDNRQTQAEDCKKFCKE